MVAGCPTGRGCVRGRGCSIIWMMGTVQSYRAAREQFERDANRLLCCERIEPEMRMRLADMLRDYKFAGALNHAVYEGIVGVGAVPARRLRELLPGRVTSLGFPDFELKEYLGQSGAREDDIDKLFESLLELTEAPQEEGQKAMGHSA